MSRERVAMQKVKELFRLRFELKLSIRKIAKCLDISTGDVSDYLKRASKSDLSWEDIKNIPHGDLSNLLFPNDSDSNKYPGLTFEDVSLELKRKGVTRQLIWEEYQAEHPEIQLSYSQFCRDYRTWQKRRKPVLRHEYKAGERCQTDFCGPTIPITCPQTGVVKQAHIFVGVLCCSNYTFAKATSSQKLPDWIDAHISMFSYFGGSPEVVMIDNLKAGVDRACIYEPITNQKFESLGAYYNTTIFPVRPYRPTDKAKAENAVQIVERWILARLRNMKFFSLGELNQAISELLEALNNKPFKQLPGSRQSVFEEIERSALKPLPKHPFDNREAELVRVGQDYHVLYNNHWYSVPYSLIGEQLELRSSPNLIQLYYTDTLVASHPRIDQVKSAVQGKTTLKEHQPPEHKNVDECDSDRWLDWGLSIGPATAECILTILTQNHPLRANRVCLGIASLARKCGAQRLEQACTRSISLGHVSYNSLKLMLNNCLEAASDEDGDAITEQTDHDNIRGPAYFEQQTKA